jgi:hypothetical protein
MEAHGIATTPATVLVDPLGGVRRGDRHGLSAASFTPGPRDRAGAREPGPADLQLPHGLRPRLEALAAEWTNGASTDGERLEAIRRHLRTEFTYARTVARFGGADPAIDFLFEGKRGHCEYFATGMALVARAAGLPARVVMGYRVGEESPFGYDIVRERNAHSWVEAWVPGRGWTTFDATPETEVPQNLRHRSSYAASLGDGARVAYDDLVDWLQRRTLGDTAVAWAVGLLVLFWIVARGSRKRATKAASQEAVLPCLAELLATLERAGYSHAEYEPLERFAARIPDADAARLLERCAALRYGGLGDANALAADVGRYARRAKTKRG